MHNSTQPEPVLTEQLRQGASALPRRHIIAVTLFVIVACAFYVTTYVNHPNHYPVGHKLSWWGWWDQGRYIASTKAIRAGDLSASEHHYPVGYPALGTLFYDVMPNDPFFIPNFLCFATICAAFVLICRRVVALTEALILCFVAVVWQASVRNNLVVAWSTIPRHTAMYALAWLAIFRCSDPMYPVFAGLSIAVIYAVRPGDILFAVPLLVVPLVSAVRERRAPAFVARFALAAAPIVVAVHIFNYLVYAAVFPRAYSVAVANVGFSFSFIPVKAFSMFINPQLLYGEPYSLIAAFPYLLLILPGAAVFVKRFGGAGVGIVVAQAVTLLYYLAFNDFLPSNVFRFQLIHYLLWVLPFFCLYAYLSFRFAWLDLGILPTMALLVASAMVFLLPNITIHPINGLNRRAPAVLSAEPGVVTFEAPKDPFDILFFAGLHTTNVEVWLDTRKLQWRRDVQVALPESGPGLSLLFYSPQRVGSVRVRASGDTANSLASTSALYYNRKWSVTFRNPRTFLANLPADLRFTDTLADHGSYISALPISPCTLPAIQVEKTDTTRGLVRRAAFPNLGSDGSPNLRFSMVASVPQETVLHRVSVTYSAGGGWMATSLPERYPVLPNLWGAAVIGPGANQSSGLYHLNGSCGPERFSVVVPLPADTADGNFEIRLDTSRGPLAATAQGLHLHAER
jgi:hypothetical protein